MADITFQCPECKQPLAVDAGSAGLQFPCPICSRSITVPQPSVTTLRLRFLDIIFFAFGTPWSLFTKNSQCSDIIAPKARVQPYSIRNNYLMRRIREVMGKPHWRLLLTSLGLIGFSVLCLDIFCDANRSPIWLIGGFVLLWLIGGVLFIASCIGRVKRGIASFFASRILGNRDGLGGISLPVG
jgi:hypothetical protein